MDLQAMMMTTRIIEAATSEDELHSIMVAITQELGFERFALIHHVDGAEAKGHAINLHNYPPRWADYYHEQGFGIRDPVHRASHLSSCGFRWEKLPDMLSLDKGDHEMLAMARDHGIANGFTIPANVPGEAHGSITFANPVDYSLPIEMLPLAHWIGNVAFEAARRLWAAKSRDRILPRPNLTDRQRDCVLWIARGKTDWEISRILGISEETVATHIRQACERYDVSKRTLLLIRTLFDGTLSFPEIFRR